MRPMRFIIRVISFTLAVASFGALFSASAETAPLNLNSGAISELPLHYVSQPADSTLLVSAASAILIEANTGTVLYAKNEKEHRSIASTTKIMTTLLTLEAGELDAPFTADPTAIKVEGTSMGLREGDIVTRRALCYGMLLPSGNDAANAAAISVSGSMSAFAEKMNTKAKALGMNDSNFVTPSGLDADGQYSCAYDLALLTSYALKNQDFKEICCLSKAKVSFGNPPTDRWLINSNKLLYSYPDCIGVKTGFTDSARRTLVSAAKRDGVLLIAVTLNAPDDWKDHTKLLDYGFSQVSADEAEYDCSGIKIPVVSGEREYIEVTLKDKAVLTLTKEQREQVTAAVYLPKFVYGGINAGDPLGEVRFILYGNVIASSELCAKQSCGTAPQEVSFFTALYKFFKAILPV